MIWKTLRPVIFGGCVGHLIGHWTPMEYLPHVALAAIVAGIVALGVLLTVITNR